MAWGYRKIPRKVVLQGNTGSAKMLIGRADSELCLLEQQMKHRSLKQGSRTIKFVSGAVIEVWSCFNLQQVSIYVPGGKEIRLPERSCWCNCNFSTGIVIDYFYLLKEGQEMTDIDEYHYPSQDIMYTVLVCHRNVYILYEGCQPTDFTQIFPEKPAITNALDSEASELCLVCLYDSTDLLMGDCLGGGYPGACGPSDEIKQRPAMSPYRIMPWLPGNLEKWEQYG